MSLNLGNIFATLSFDITPFKKAVDTVTGQVKQMGANMSKAFGSTNGSMNNMNNSANNLTSSVNKATQAANKMGDSFRDVERIVGGIVISQAFYNGLQAIQSGVSAIVGFSNNMQTAQVTMENFLGSAERAEAFVKVMQDFAASTPFSTEQSLDLSKKLMAMGFQANSIRSVMQVLVDTAAGTGGTADELQRIVIALGQINTQGTIMGQEMRQLANANIPVYKILQEELGLTGEQLKNIGHLKIPADVGIKALLTGLQKQYAGMSDAINEKTLVGMWSNIKDNMLIIGEQVIKAPYEALNNFVRRIYDVLEEARDVITRSGLGGLFEHFVPKELHTAIRVIVASMKDMINTFGLMYKAVSPVIALVGTWFTQALANVAPIIATVTRHIAQIVNAAMSASPALRYFAAAVVSLMVANAAATSLMFLWRVMRFGMIAAAVSKAVMMLARAIQILTFMMAKNPLVRVIAIAAAALVYLASTSATAAAWIDTLKAKIASLTGIDIGGTLEPVDNKSIEEYMEGFDTDFLGDVNDTLKDTGKELADTGKGMANTGKEADKAGKKIKDKFVASFDELYQVPDQLDSLGDKLDEVGDGGIGDMGGGMALPDFEIPEIKAPDLTNIKNAFKDIPNLIPAIPAVPIPFKFEWPNFTPPNFAVVTDALGTVNLALEQLRLKFLDFGASVGTIFNGLGAHFGSWTLGGLGAIGDFVTGGLERLGEFATKGGYIITNLVNGISQGFLDMVNATGGAVSKWASNISDVFADMVGGITGALATALNAIGDFVGDSAAWFNKLSVDVVGNFNKWTSTVVVTVTAFATAVGNLFKKLGTDITGTVTSLATNTTAKWNSMTDSMKKAWETFTTNAKATMTSWATSLTTTMTTLGTNLTTNFKKTWDSVSSGITTFTKNAQTTISTWAKGVNKNWNTLMTNLMTNMGKGMDAMGTNFTKGLTTIGSNVALWVTGVSKGATDLFNSLVKNSGLMAKAVGSNFASMAKSGWGTMSNFFSGLAKGAANWAQSFVSTLWSGLKAAWKAVAEFGSSLGQDVKEMSGNAVNTISNAYNGMAGWVGEHKTEILIGAGITAAVGTAFALAPFTGGWSLAPLLALETGGIVDQHQLVEIGEGNKREAVIPLQNSTYMKPFSAAVANDLAGMMGELWSANSGNSGSQQPTMYVHTLVADDKALKELERKLEIVRLNENARKGG